MKFAFSAVLLVNSVAAFAARPFPFWGRSSSASAVATASFVGRDDRQGGNKNTCLQATPAAVDSKPAVVEAGNWELLSVRGQAALSNLIQADEGFGAQTHVYNDWPAPGTDDEGKKRLADQVGFEFVFLLVVVL